VNYLRNSPHGIAILLVLFALIWGADSGAYFVGKKWGKHKLLPQVSPGKTWEGLSGALGVTVIITFFSLFIFKVPYIRWPVALCLALITVLFSIVGDLFESMLKRRVGLKDSGHSLPGHGGILDRIDSLTAAAPIFASGLLISHWI
jgi:phosphatidate cytidylyltransferase